MDTKPPQPPPTSGHPSTPTQLAARTSRIHRVPPEGLSPSPTSCGQPNRPGGPVEHAAGEGPNSCPDLYLLSGSEHVASCPEGSTSYRPPSDRT
jgi:hypothetical protein